MTEEHRLRHDLERAMERENRFLSALLEIREVVEKRQLPITNHVYNIANEALARVRP